VQSIQETVVLLLIGISVLRGIPRQGVKLVDILNHIGIVLLQIEELIALHLDWSSRDMCLAELGGELFPVDDVVSGLHSLDVLPPCSRWSGEKVGGKNYLLLFSNSSYLQVVLDGAEPVVSVEGCGALREHRRVGVLKVPKARSGRFLTMSSFFIFVVAVSRSKLSDLPKRGDVGFTLGTRILTALHQESKNLGHVALRGWWWWRVFGTGTSMVSFDHLVR
jgi:hypothetical protein